MKRTKKTFSILDKNAFTKKALVWAENHPYFCYLNGNNSKYSYESFPELLAIGNSQTIQLQDSSPFEDLATIFLSNDWYFGFVGYELNSGKLPSKDTFPKGYFFCPETIIRFIGNETIEIESTLLPDKILGYIQETKTKEKITLSKPVFQARLNRQAYIKTIEKLKQHLNRGDIYQINFCVDFNAVSTTIDPVLFYQELNKESPMPFSGLLKLSDRYIICASPERYLKRIGSKIVSQPMKGTSPRDTNPTIDQTNLLELIQSQKERAENIMIVDLVRNDLSRFCQSGTVQVEKLCEVYSFHPVHQMVSTVTGTLEYGVTSEKIIRDTFPMGSMTGAPKVRAMELIEQYETTQRSAFSGALGYVEPNGNFDFNVLIRSLFYNKSQATLTYSVGSGITALSDPIKEYEECMLKASSIQQVSGNYLGNSFSN